MISHKHRCIFVHIPKTAGTSVENALRRSSAGFESFTPDDFNIDRIPPHAGGYRGLNRWDIKHFPAKFLREEYRDYFKFCFVRNPWDLVVSCYFWWIQQTRLEFRKLQGQILEQLGFTNFAFSFYTDYINEIFHQGMGQCYWLLDDCRTPLVSFIGRFETLQHDYDLICNRIGIEQTQLPSLNRSVHRSYKDYYNTNTQKLVELKFNWDIERFGYCFQKENKG